MIEFIVKRDGREDLYDRKKIQNAIFKAARSVGGSDELEAERLSHIVEDKLKLRYNKPTVEEIQDMVEEVLVKEGKDRTAKEYITYRGIRSKVREKNSQLMNTFRDLTFKDAKDNDLKRENANIDSNTPMGTMLKYGSEAAKTFVKLFGLKSKHSQLHEEGWIHIHDLDFYSLTTTCCQIETSKLLKDGFSTGHGFVREPASIRAASALVCIAIQANQNDQHGGQSVPDFEYGLAPYVMKSYIKIICEVLDIAYSFDGIEPFNKEIKRVSKSLGSLLGKEGQDYIKKSLLERGLNNKEIKRVISISLRKINEEVKQAMEALIHNLNTMHSRAGAQIPFSSINYGTGTTEEQRLIIKYVLDATWDGLGDGETPIFPIQIFKLKEGINFNPGDKNYDLFRRACEVSAKRLFPNFSFLDAEFNEKYYKEGHPETEVAYMGCRTRVMANVYDKTKEIVSGRGNLSFTSINLPRLAIESKNLEHFFQKLGKMMDIVFDQLNERYKVQGNKRVINYPFLMGQGIWIDSDKLDPEDKLEEVLKHGTLSVGFIGLAEALVKLVGKHHGQSTEARGVGYSIVSFMRKKCDKQAEITGMNYTLLATPAEGLSGRFLNMDKQKYGLIEGVTDREYYTNSFHIPVYFPISIKEKIKIEAQYHQLTNAGHITYVEMDGNPLDNVEAFMQIISYMKECGVGYGSINHPVDRDPVCGYTGIIGDVCPKCGRKSGEPIDLDKLKKLGVKNSFTRQ